MSIYQESEKTIICGEEVDYIKPSLSTMPLVTQWIIQGFAPTFLSKAELDEMNNTAIFEAAIGYVTEVNSLDISQNEKNSVWGTALVTSDATIKYLFPAISRCFPGTDVYQVTSEALNELMTMFFTDYFQFITENQPK